MIPAHFQFLPEAGYVFSSALLAAIGLLGFFLYRQSHRRARAEAEVDRLELESLHRELRIAQQRYGGIFERSKEGILVAMAQDLAIVEANGAARRMVGLEDGSLPKLTEICQLALGPNEAAPANAYEWFSLICRHRRLSFVRKEGAVVALEVDSAPVEFDSKPAFQFFLREITDRLQLEEQLRQAQKLSTVGHMVCSIAHELCNPLAVVNGYAEILLERKELDSSVRAQLEKVKYEANRASKLVKNFLSYSHQRPVKREPLNLNDSVHRALEILSLELRDVCAETVLQLDVDLPKAIADSDQVQQILVNLVHNSLQAIGTSRGTPRLFLTTHALDEKIVLKIEDNGPGIPKDVLARIFEPYFTTKPVGLGTGLGLSIAHNIMTEHKGRIYYKAAACGGAGFVLEFPRATDDVAVETAVTPAQPKKTKSNAQKRILVLDDQDTIGELLAEMVRLIGHEAIVESDPQRALERVEEEKFAVVLSDYRMPGMNGQEFYRAAIAIRPEVENRIIFLTGDLMNEETHQFLTESGAPYLRKPFHLSKVEAAIGKILKGTATSAT
jgi:two-component system, NtrC family, sensor kinase